MSLEKNVEAQPSSRWLARILIGAGLALVLPWSLSQLEARRALAGAHAALDAPPGATPGRSAQPLGSREPAPGELVGLLEIRRLRLEAPVLEGTGADVLRRAAGHVPQSALPEDAGNVAVAAHRDSLFRKLEDALPGDLVQLRRPGGMFTYRVEKTWVTDPSDLSVLEDGPRPTLTLITCYPFHYVGPAPHRFVVRARLVSAERSMG